MASKSTKRSSSTKNANTSAKSEANPSVLSFAQFANGGKAFESAQYEKMSNDAAEAGRQIWDAYVECGTAVTKGMEEMVQALTSITQEAVARGNETVNELVACKTLTEVTELQNRAAQQGFNDFMQNMTRLSEIGIRTATQVFEPINMQMSNSVRKSDAA